MSDRYIADRFLPDKAIDLIDEAAAKLKMEITSKPLRLDEIDRKVPLHAVPCYAPRALCFAVLCSRCCSSVVVTVHGSVHLALLYAWFTCPCCAAAAAAVAACQVAQLHLRTLQLAVRLVNQLCAAHLQILQLEMERLSLAKAVSDRASKQRLDALDSQLKKLKAEQVWGPVLCPCLHISALPACYPWALSC